MRLILLVEEPSMKAFLEGLLPNLAPALPFHCVAFEGKSDLRKNAARKIRGWREPGARFVVLVDQDHDDCKRLKSELVSTVASAGGGSEVTVRIVCRSLESWLLGDLNAVATHPTFAGRGVSSSQAKFRDPDALANASEELGKLLGQKRLQKVEAARILGAVFQADRATSTSFRVFAATVMRALTLLPYA
jgi:hypothetical protein